MPFFDHQSIFFTALGYSMSYLEFFATVAGAIAVWLSARANVWSWPLGIINVVLSFFLFFQVQLYPDMFLQVFFFVTNLMGWWRWTHPLPDEEDKKKELRVSFTSVRILMLSVGVSIVGTVLFGTLASSLHRWLPAVFTLPSAFPYLDSFVTVISIVATFLMIQKKIECWAFWIAADVVATGLYFSKGILFFSAEYLAFCFIALFGLLNWIREYKLLRTTT